MVQVTVLFHNGKEEHFQMPLDAKSFLVWAMKVAENKDVMEVKAQFENGELCLH